MYVLEWCGGGGRTCVYFYIEVEDPMLRVLSVRCLHMCQCWHGIGKKIGDRKHGIPFRTPQASISSRSRSSISAAFLYFSNPMYCRYE
jgi:hypothetical protein